MGFKALENLACCFRREKEEYEEEPTDEENALPTPDSSIPPAAESSEDSNNVVENRQQEPDNDDHGSQVAVENTSLWKRAYRSLQQSDSEMLKKFEELLYHELVNENDNQERLNPNDAEEADMLMLVTRGLKRTEKAAKGKEIAQSAVDFILRFKGAIDAGTQASPAAATVWTALSLGLNLFIEPLKEGQTNRDGIIYVVARMKWYDSLSDSLLEERKTMRTPNFPTLQSLEETLLALYQGLIKFTTLSVLSYYRHQGLQFLRDFANLGSWDSALQAVKANEKLLRQDIQEHSTIKISSQFSELLDTADELKDELISLRESVVAAIETQTASEQRRHIEKEVDDYLQELYVARPDLDMRAIESRKDKLIDKAYDWILKTDHYRSVFNWDVKAEAEPAKRLLWIRGDAGTGKTMMTIGIVRELESAMKSRRDAALSYFFVQAADTEHNNANAVLRTLIWYLANQKRHFVPRYLREHQKTARGIFSSKGANFLLSDILRQISQDDTLSQVVLLIDALDECRKIDLDNLMETICTILEHCPRVRIVLSSRPQNRWIEDGLERVATLMATVELDPELLSGPVEAYIQQRTSRLMPRFKPETVDTITPMLRDKAGMTFLWVALVCQRLNKVDDHQAVKVVSEMPSGLKELYQNMFQEITALEDEDREYCFSVLGSVMVASVPLALAELKTLADLPPNVSVRTIANKCGSFLTIQNEKVYFVHQSAQEYLEGAKECFKLRLGDLNEKMLKRSLEGLKSTLRRDIYGLKSLGTLKTDITKPSTDPLGSVRYCCLHWADHLSEVSEKSQLPANLILDFLRTAFLNWIEALALLGDFATAISSNLKLRKYSKERRTPVHESINDFTIDAERFLLFNREGIELAPLQVYTSALIFTPTGSLVRKLFQNEAPSWVSVAPIEPRWGLHLGLIEPQLAGYLQDAVISTNDGTLACWTIAHGNGERKDFIEVLGPDLSTVVFRIELEVNDASLSELLQMVLLPGGHIALLRYPNKIRFYDSRGELMRECEVRGVTWKHESRLGTLAVGPAGDIIVDPGDGTIQVLSSECQEKTVLHEGPTSDTATCFVMLPDGCIVSGTTDGTLRLWKYPGYLPSAGTLRCYPSDSTTYGLSTTQDRYRQLVSSREQSGPANPRGDNFILELASSPTGLVASLLKPRLPSEMGPTVIKLWRSRVDSTWGLDCVATILENDHEIRSFTFISDDRLVAFLESILTRVKVLYFWDTSGLVHGPQAQEYVTPDRYILTTWISPNGKIAMCYTCGSSRGSAGSDNLQIWDITGCSPALRGVLEGFAKPHPRTTIHLSDDAKRMSVARWNKQECRSFEWWDIVSEKMIPLRTLERDHLIHPPLGIALTRDGGTAAWISRRQGETEDQPAFKVSLADLGDDTVRVHDCSIDGLGRDATAVAGLAISPDQKTLAVAVAKEESGSFATELLPLLKVEGVELVDFSAGSRSRSLELQSDAYVLAGKSRLVWSPDGKFVLFRYLIEKSGTKEEVTIWELGETNATKSWKLGSEQGSPANLPFDVFGVHTDIYRETEFGFNVQDALSGTAAHPKYEIGVDDDAQESLWMKKNGERMVFIPERFSAEYIMSTSRPNICGQGGKLVLTPRSCGLLLWSFPIQTMDNEG
ncbi:hypothetical protein diail_3899 [Diaporthe ilicicola]|nr:hypothetical protein diail_3899 [Diaporthe ilicicola]